MPERRRHPALKFWTVAVLICALCALLVGGLPTGPVAAQEKPLTVFAAASLKDALDAVAKAWQDETGGSLSISFAATSALARQIEQGAPADIFISADQDWMDYVQERGLIDDDTRIDLLANRLVLIAPQASSVDLTIEPDFPLAAQLGEGRLAMANVDAVPAGKYGKAALQALGVWPEVEGHIAQAQNVRAALALVARGEAPLGIVYRTDALAEPRVRVVGLFPESSHPPIVYPAALLKGAGPEEAEASRFMQFLRGEEARQLLQAQGFTVLAAPDAR